MTRLADLPAEQLAPYSAPEPSDTATVRDAIEAHKRRLNESDPIPHLQSRGGTDL